MKNHTIKCVFARGIRPEAIPLPGGETALSSYALLAATRFVRFFNNFPLGLTLLNRQETLAS